MSGSEVQGLRITWTGRLSLGEFRGVLKVRGTDAWVWECKHNHVGRLQAMECAHAEWVRRRDDVR